MKFLIGLASKFFHIQPATATTKTFAIGLGWIGSALAGATTLYLNGDLNYVDYAAPAAALLHGFGVIFKRDAITKLADTIQSISPSK
jgi:hypothetical protein